MILLGNKILKEQLEKCKKIQADHCERIRILELAIQNCQGFLNTRNIWSMDKEDLVIDENRLKRTLNEAMTKSHEIAIKEY